MSMITALFAGLLSFLSPCILPLVPFYISFLAGSGAAALSHGQDVPSDMRRRAVASAAVFVAGVITIFVILGASATSVGLLLRDYFDVLRWIAGGIIFLMGLHFLWLVRIPLLNRQLRMDVGGTKRPSFAGAYVVGLAFGFGWTPCAGPVLSVILFLAGAQESAARGGLLLLTYGIGMTAPFVFAAILAPQFMRWMARMRPYLGYVERVQGLVLVVFGVLIATGALSNFAFWLQESFSIFHSIG